MIDLTHRVRLLQDAYAHPQYSYRGARVEFHKLVSPLVAGYNAPPTCGTFETITCERVGRDEWRCSDIPENIRVSKPLD